MSAPAGWYPDPTDASVQRWWDGRQWTAHSSLIGLNGPHYAVPQYQGYGVPPKVAVATNTRWIWFAIAVSAVPMLSLLVFDWHGYLQAHLGSGSSRDPSDLMQWQVRNILRGIVSWAVVAAYVVMSWLDWRELRRRGVPLPFHWAWSFLGLLVYTIGRAVVLKRRTVSGGWAPMWATIGLTVVGLIVGIVFFISLMGMMMEMITSLSGRY